MRTAIFAGLVTIAGAIFASAGIDFAEHYGASTMNFSAVILLIFMAMDLIDFFAKIIRN